jgi:hypothetical protein
VKRGGFLLFLAGKISNGFDMEIGWNDVGSEQTGWTYKFSAVKF